MKNSLLIASFIFGTFCTFAQSEINHHCSKRDRFHAVNKSASLTVAQIAETERYDVHFYALDISMDNLSTYVEGTGEIHGTARETLDSVLFELFPSFTVTEIRLNGNPITYSRVASRIKVPVNLTIGQSFQIAVDYAGTPPTAATNPLGGAGMTNATSPSWGAQVTWSLSEPFSAYEWWPCKQSLRDKADSVAVKVTVPNNCKAGSNGVLEDVVDLGNGYSRYEWMHRHAIDYYLVSVAIANYVEYTIYANPIGAANPILIQNFIYANPATLPYFQDDIDETVDFLELFSDLYGMYPFADEKYGHCMAPLSGGMEHQTMTTQGFFNKGLTSHELGHQWWGDNITCASWADIWVNEGFASYSEYLMLEDLYPAEKAQDMQDRHNNIMSSNGGSTWVEDSLNDGRIFSGRLTYDKGAAIIHTFRFMMDDDANFFQALKNLQIDFADSTLIGLDVRDAFQAQSGVDFTNAFNEWYFGEGFPTYSARWNTVGNDLLIELTHTTSSTTPTFTNPLEVRFARSGAADTTVRFAITGTLNQFMIPNMGNVTSISQVDPNNWIINQVGTVVKDPSFIASIDENENAEVFTVSPNPSYGIFYVETSNAETFSYRIVDTRGKLIESGTFTNGLSINLSTKQAGYYLIQLSNSSGQKWIKTLLKQ